LENKDLTIFRQQTLYIDFIGPRNKLCPVTKILPFTKSPVSCQCVASVLPRKTKDKKKLRTQIDQTTIYLQSVALG